MRIGKLRWNILSYLVILRDRLLKLGLFVEKLIAVILEQLKFDSVVWT